MKPISRRGFLRLAAASGAGALLAACAPQVVEKTVTVKETVQVEKVVTAVPKTSSWQGTIEMWISGYTPDVPRGAGLNPLTEPRKLAEEWMAKHPGAKLKFIEGPGQNANLDQIGAWMKAQQAAGTMPDLSWTQDNLINRDVGTNYWISIDPWINTPNPYIPTGQPGNQVWREAFYAGFDARNKAIDGRYYGAPLSFTAVQVYVNEDLLKKAGVDIEKEIIDPRWDFDKMLQISDKLKKAGIIPWAQGWQQSYWNWLQTSTFTGLFKSTGLWDKLDTDKDNFVTSMEHFQGIARGDVKANSPEYLANYKMNKDWSPYWADGWQGGQVDAKTLFMTGKAAFYWDGTWNYQTVKSDPERKFQFRVVRFPDCAKRMAEIGKGGKTTYPGGAADQIGITATAAKKGSVDLCVNWLKYFLSCDGQTRVCKEHGSIPPVVKCASGNPELLQFSPLPDETLLLTVHMQSMHASFGQDYQRIIGEYLAGTKTLEQATAEFQKSMDTWAKDAIDRAQKK